MCLGLGFRVSSLSPDFWKLSADYIVSEQEPLLC